MKNDQISLYCHFNKTIKKPGTSFQSPVSSQKHVRNICHTAYYYLTKLHFNRTSGFKRNKHNCNFYYVAMFMMTSQTLKSMNFTKTQKSKNLVNETLFFLWIKKCINYTLSATLQQKNTFVAEVTFKLVFTTYFSPNDSPSKTMKISFYFI